MPSSLSFVTHKLDETAFDGFGKRDPMNIAQTIGTALMISCYSIGATTLENSLSKGIVSSGRQGVSLCRPVDHLRRTDDNMFGCAQEAAVGRTVGAFEDDRPRGCKDFENTILMIVFEIHDITNAESGGAAVTEGHLGRVGAKIGEGRRNDPAIRKLLSLRKRSSLKNY